MTSHSSKSLDRSSKSIDNENAKQDLDDLSRKSSGNKHDEQSVDNLWSGSRDDEHVEQDLDYLLSMPSDDENVLQSVGDLLSNLSDDGHPGQDLVYPLSKSSDDENVEQSVGDLLSKSSDDGHPEQDLDYPLSKSMDDEHVEQAFDGNHAEGIPRILTTSQPHWQEEVYESIEHILKDISLGLNNIPRGLLRSEHLSQWTFNNPSGDPHTNRLELFLQQEDHSEEERADRIMDWLDKQFPRIRTEEPFASDDDTEMDGRDKQNKTDSFKEANPRWFYTEIDFGQWHRPSQGGHPRGSFVKEGGDWRCVSAKMPSSLLQNGC